MRACASSGLPPLPKPPLQPFSRAANLHCYAALCPWLYFSASARATFVFSWGDSCWGVGKGGDAVNINWPRRHKHALQVPNLSHHQHRGSPASSMLVGCSSLAIHSEVGLDLDLDPMTARHAAAPNRTVQTQIHYELLHLYLSCRHEQEQCSQQHGPRNGGCVSRKTTPLQPMTQPLLPHRLQLD